MNKRSLRSPALPVRAWLPALLILLLPALPARGQRAGQFGVQVEAQIIPQVGVRWHLTDRWAARAGFYFQGAPSEPIDWDASFTSLAVEYRFPLDAQLQTYAGADFSFFDDLQSGFLPGVFVGTQYQPHDRFGVFGEFGLSTSSEGLDLLQLFNTGVGVVFYLNP